mmetsp:Transcript_21270/g.35628  ORF Transcript_21270/g.35628 Transcript_21270/m.35628 type:complete len:278 (+) Transcript_21270:134-967(+)|eukprot:CAMPEP_0174968828 /NCGR_PEP_ID=MMETSP0004_2-20121128/8371_1 /TAXON_ID=420556 /ORGANISM="Ochromonas sp., Strain CCMP1393" /LENGTH=277 /DNA_ID=CAMNT_0016218145 /DNA_START=106 /DNA_END=939 /DNA_ORIENTATION=+
MPPQPSADNRNLRRSSDTISISNNNNNPNRNGIQNQPNQAAPSLSQNFVKVNGSGPSNSSLQQVSQVQGRSRSAPAGSVTTGGRIPRRGNSNTAPMENIGMNYGSSGMGYGGGYGTGTMYGMGGMGYGGGMMGYGMGYGMGGMMGGPMAILYSINYFIAMIGQLTAMLGMSSQAVWHLFGIAKEALIKLEKIIRTSEFRRWLQRKSRKSPLLRYLFVVSSMLLTSQVIRLARYLIESQLGKSTISLTSSVSAPVSVAALDNVASMASTAAAPTPPAS